MPIKPAPNLTRTPFNFGKLPYPPAPLYPTQSPPRGRAGFLTLAARVWPRQAGKVGLGCEEALEGAFPLGTGRLWPRWCRSRCAWRAKLSPHSVQMNHGTAASSGWPWWSSRNCLNRSTSCPARTLPLLLIPTGLAGFVAGFVAGFWWLPDVSPWSE